MKEGQPPRRERIPVIEDGSQEMFSLKQAAAFIGCSEETFLALAETDALYSEDSFCSQKAGNGVETQHARADLIYSIKRRYDSIPATDSTMHALRTAHREVGCADTTFLALAETDPLYNEGVTVGMRRTEKGAVRLQYAQVLIDSVKRRYQEEHESPGELYMPTAIAHKFIPCTPDAFVDLVAQHRILPTEGEILERRRGPIEVTYYPRVYIERLQKIHGTDKSQERVQKNQKLPTQAGVAAEAPRQDVRPAAEPIEVIDTEKRTQLIQDCEKWIAELHLSIQAERNIQRKQEMVKIRGAIQPFLNALREGRSVRIELLQEQFDEAEEYCRGDEDDD